MMKSMSPLSLDSDDELTSSYRTSSFGSSTISRSSSCYDDPRGLSCAASPPPSSLPPVFPSSRKPRHRSSSDPSWAAILRRRGPLGPQDFRLLRRVGSGDIGTVYLCQLINDESDGGEKNCTGNPLLYAMKVVDRRELEKKKKLGRAEAERRVLRSLDHPFLPTLYADFDAAHYSCVVTEFCSAGDLHSLRHLQPTKRFPLKAVRFYAAEVLVALEYLHMLGIVYRDLKPENVLIRSDGHIMLSDFDLSFESDASPVLDHEPDNADDNLDDEQPSCLPTRLLSFMRKQRESKNRLGFLRRCSSSSSLVPTRPRFVAEPAAARSHSFVGTHEYVAPEVVSGRAHGGQVDWWAYGVFVYELLHGRTPFVGPTNEATLRNILAKPLSFPSSPGPPDQKPARDMVARLLSKDPCRRLGSARGAADVKTHLFFRGVNFPLLRTVKPPVVPGVPAAVEGKKKKNSKKNMGSSGRFGTPAVGGNKKNGDKYGGDSARFQYF